MTRLPINTQPMMKAYTQHLFINSTISASADELLASFEILSDDTKRREYSTIEKNA